MSSDDRLRLPSLRAGTNYLLADGISDLIDSDRVVKLSNEIEVRTACPRAPCKGGRWPLIMGLIYNGLFFGAPGPDTSLFVWSRLILSTSLWLRRKFGP
jgi:hypothetical protein